MTDLTPLSGAHLGQTIEHPTIDEMTNLEELRRLLKVCQYDRAGLQRRLDAVREAKDQIIRLLDSPTMKEHLEAGGGVLDFIGGKRWHDGDQL